MDEPNAERTNTPGRSWPGASLCKSLKLGWRWRRLRRAVVAASEAAQGHEANGLPPGSREFKTLFNEVASKVQEYSTGSGDPLETLKARLPALQESVRRGEITPVQAAKTLLEEADGAK